MSWNGSNKGSGSVSSTRQNQKNDPHHSSPSSSSSPSPSSSPSSFNFRALAAGLIVIGLALAAYFFLFSSKDEPTPAKSGPKPQAVEKTPSPAHSSSVSNAVAKVESPKERPPQKIGEIRDGKILLANGRLCEYKNVHTNRTSAIRPKYKIFKHPSENIIASLLCIKPGETLVGGLPRFNGRITADFLESLKEPIEPQEGDSEENKQLRKLVAQAKLELKAAYDRGEDIEEILANERREGQKLAQFKQSVAKMAFENVKNCESEADFDTLIEAANKMLEEKGIAPLKQTPISRLRMKMFVREEKK